MDDYLDGYPNFGVFNSFNLNLYNYCAQNPVIYRDPNGREYEEGWGPFDPDEIDSQGDAAEDGFKTPMSVRLSRQLYVQQRVRGKHKGKWAKHTRKGVKLLANPLIWMDPVGAYSYKKFGVWVKVFPAFRGFQKVIIRGRFPSNYHKKGKGGRSPKMKVPKVANGKKYGSYTITYKSGMKYHGKGGHGEMRKQARKVGEKYKDEPVSYEWSSAKHEKASLRQEAKRIKDDGGPGKGKYRNYNHRNSSGSGKNKSRW